MTLPVPNLDDRRFQQLVDEAKRMVQQRCPEWTDHNVSDPGVTLIETFAYMVDTLIYRLNRVPERTYVKFLDLIGVRLFPATAATVPLTFWLSAPQQEPVAVPAGTVAATQRTESEEAIAFGTVSGLAIVPCSFSASATHARGEQPRDVTDLLTFGQGFACFSSPPVPGDAFLVGLSEPVPSCAVRLSLDSRVEGIGVDPLDPPLVWEAWDGSTWQPCEIDSDDTGGLNRAGDVVLHVPATHTASVLVEQRAGWLRARVLAAQENQPFYSASPRVSGMSAATVGGTTPAANAEDVRAEIIGMSEGVPGQRFLLQQAPALASREPVELEVAGGSGWLTWTEVETFADSDGGDRHFALDRVGGEVLFGPAVREPTGLLRHYGAVPPKGAPIRCVSYQVGGGRRGNVAAGLVNVLKTTIPFVGDVVNRYGATGGVDGETVEAAKVRGPLLLRSRDRAVTAADYEHLAAQAAPEVARVLCVPAGSSFAGAVRLLVVPAADVAPDGAVRFEQLVPTDDTLRRIAEHLDERRCIGARVVVEPPTYQGVTIVARLRARGRSNPMRLRQEALTALNRRFNPLVGGSAGDGWPFGRLVHVGEVYAVLQDLPGCEIVLEARLYGADPITGARGEQTDRLEVDAQALVFSYGHQIRVDR